MFCCALSWDISPSEFWNMTQSEWWAIYRHHESQQRSPVNHMTKDEAADLYEWAMARKEETDGIA
jgi:hypothetical protein